MQPIPSATVMMIREGAEGLEVLAVLRGQAVSFARGALAFPGGVLEPGDHHLAQELGADDPLAPFRLGAIREVFEETGLLLAHGQHRLTVEMLARIRELLLSGEPDFATLLADHHLQPALDALVHIAHWTTPASYPKRFSTHFFLAPAPPERDASHEQGELDDAFWMRPQHALKWHREGRYMLMLPTLQSCGRLAEFATVAEALAGMEFELHP
ncbi:MAG: NUDIX domain-containing protein [Bacteroidales bacterium]|nr:NUDIX domain-containing protein [Bacteroidales bacterium]